MNKYGHFAERELQEKAIPQAISAVLLPSFFERRHNERPHTDDVTDNIQKAGKRDIACFNGHAKRLPRLDPVSMFCPNCGSTFPDDPESGPTEKDILGP